MFQYLDASFIRQPVSNKSSFANNHIFGTFLSNPSVIPLLTQDISSRELNAIVPNQEPHTKRPHRVRPIVSRDLEGFKTGVSIACSLLARRRKLWIDG